MGKEIFHLQTFRMIRFARPSCFLSGCGGETLRRFTHAFTCRVPLRSLSGVRFLSNKGAPTASPTQQAPSPHSASTSILSPLHGPALNHVEPTEKLLNMQLLKEGKPAGKWRIVFRKLNGVQRICFVDR